jgi:hypothetical protein
MYKLNASLGSLTIGAAAGTTTAINGTSPLLTTIDGSNTQIFVIAANNSVTISSLKVTGGGMMQVGGGAIDNSGTLTIKNSNFSNNLSYSTANGGAILSRPASTLTILGSTFSGNVSEAGDGAIDAQGMTTITNSTFNNNSAPGNGGAIENSGTLIVGNSTFAGNSAGNGGAISNDNGATAIVANSTFYSNSASTKGAALFNDSGTLVIKNSILNGSTAKSCSGTITDGSHNLEFPGNTCGFTVNAVNTDPLLSPLANNGGPNMTVAIAQTSPAKDAGSNTICAGSPILNVDERGVARPVGTNCDIGAYEYTAQPMVITQIAPNAVIGTNYAGILAAIGGTQPYGNWTITSGTLPPGISLDTTGTFTGTATTLGTWNFGVKVSDSAALQSPEQPLSMSVVPAPPTISTTTLPAGTVGTSYSSTLTGTGGTSPYVGWTISSGSLPGGLTLDTASGMISGTPTAFGTFSFSVQMTDSSSVQSVAANLSMTISPAPLPPSIMNTSVADGTLGVSYAQTLTATGGAAPYNTWTVSSGSLPDGLTLDAASGMISGTPTIVGTSIFSITVKDSNSLVSTPTAFNLTINNSGNGPTQQAAGTQQTSGTEQASTDFFTDTVGHWAELPIATLHVSCNVNGYLDSSGNPLHLFKPDIQISRAELLTMAIKCKYGVIPQPLQSSYTDVDVNNWASPYIEKAKALGIVTGYSDGSFRPNQNASRAEALKMILLTWVPGDQITKAQPVTQCKDVAQDQWYAPYFNFGVTAGIISGYKDSSGNLTGQCGTANNITRAESAKIITGING